MQYNVTNPLHHVRRGPFKSRSASRPPSTKSGCFPRRAAVAFSSSSPVLTRFELRFGVFVTCAHDASNRTRRIVQVENNGARLWAPAVAWGSADARGPAVAWGSADAWGPAVATLCGASGSPRFTAPKRDGRTDGRTVVARASPSRRTPSGSTRCTAASPRRSPERARRLRLLVATVTPLGHDGARGA